MMLLIVAMAMGAFATLTIDLWAWGMRRGFGIRSLDFCLLGRWVLHMRSGRWMHEDITRSAPQANECVVGWGTHYSIGIGFALLFVLLTPSGWLEHPTVLPAIAFGVVTVAVPFATMQPALGLGFAASRTPYPGRARLKSTMTHAVYGLGLYASALVLSRLLP